MSTRYQTTPVKYTPPAKYTPVSKVYVEESIAAFNSSALYNTCMFSSLFLGLRNTRHNLKVGTLFEDVFKFIPFDRIGEHMEVYSNDLVGSAKETSSDLGACVKSFLQFISRKYSVKIIFWTCTKHLGYNDSCPGIDFMKGIRVDSIGSYPNAVSMVLNGGHFYYMYGHARTDQEIVCKGQTYCKSVEKHRFLSGIYDQELRTIISDIIPDLDRKTNGSIEDDAMIAQALYQQEMDDAIVHNSGIGMPHQALPYHPTQSYVPPLVPVQMQMQAQSQSSSQSGYPILQQPSHYDNDAAIARGLNQELNGGADLSPSIVSVQPKVSTSSPPKSSPVKSSPAKSSSAKSYSDHELATLIKNSQFAQDLFEDPALFRQAQQMYFRIKGQGLL